MGTDIRREKFKRLAADLMVGRQAHFVNVNSGSSA